MAAVVLAACSSDGLGVGDASADRALVPGGGDGGEGADSANDATELFTTVRLVHLAQDLGRVDICYRAPSSQTFAGPLLGSTPVEAGTADASPLDASPLDAWTDGGTDAATDAPAAAPDGGGDAGAAATSGLGYLHATSYRVLAGAGTFEIALVDAGDVACATPRLTHMMTLDAGKRTTLVLMGRVGEDAGGAAALGLAAFTDDGATDAILARSRFVHAAFGVGTVPSAGALAVGVVGNTGVALAASVAPGQASTPSGAPPVVDVLGYHAEAPFASPLAIRLTPIADAGAAWTSASRDLAFAAATVHTGFIVSDDPGALAVLWCLDSASSKADDTCTLLRANGL